MFSIGFYFHHFSSEHLSIKLFNIVIICTHYVPYRLFVVNAGKIVINCMQLHLCRNLVVHSSFGARSINKNSVFVCVCVPCVSSKKKQYTWWVFEEPQHTKTRTPIFHGSFCVWGILKCNLWYVVVSSAMYIARSISNSCALHLMYWHLMSVFALSAAVQFGLVFLECVYMYYWFICRLSKPNITFYMNIAGVFVVISTFDASVYLCQLVSRARHEIEWAKKTHTQNSSRKSASKIDASLYLYIKDLTCQMQSKSRLLNQPNGAIYAKHRR